MTLGVREIGELYAIALARTGGDRELACKLVDAYLKGLTDAAIIASRVRR